MSELKFTISLLAIVFGAGFCNYLKGNVVALSAVEQDSLRTRSNEPIFLTVESSPEFPGGALSLFNFIRRESKYRVTNNKYKASGTVHLRLLIEKDGSVSNANISFSDAKEKFKEEAKRIVTQMPRWKPGRQSGRFLRTYSIIIIHFR